MALTAANGPIRHPPPDSRVTCEAKAPMAQTAIYRTIFLTSGRFKNVQCLFIGVAVVTNIQFTVTVSRYTLWKSVTSRLNSMHKQLPSQQRRHLAMISAQQLSILCCRLFVSLVVVASMRLSNYHSWHCIRWEHSLNTHLLKNKEIKTFTDSRRLLDYHSMLSVLAQHILW